MEQHTSNSSPLLNSSGESNANKRATHKSRVRRTEPGPTSELSKRRGSLSAAWKVVVQISGQGWTAEIFCCFFAMCSLAGLIILLLTHQDKTLPAWPQLVTINSIISVFTLLMRASIGFVLAEGISQSKWQWFRRPQRLVDMERFDNASRGAWGSILLLCRFPRRRLSWIAALGALITIMASLLGFFTQQLVQFQDCLQRDGSTMASISKTNNYNTSGLPVGSNIFDVYLPMIVAINTGIIQPNSDYTNILSHNCMTGNCTFPAEGGASFSTLGVSHSCKDVTSEVEKKRFTIYKQDENVESYAAHLNTTYRKDVRMSYPSDTVLSTGSMKNESSDIATIKMIYRSSFRHWNYSAISCTIFPAVHTYGVNVTRSVMRETLVNITRVGPNLLAGKPGPDEFVAYKLATSQSLRNGTRVSCDGRTTSAPGYAQVAHGNIDAIPSRRSNASIEDSEIWYYPEDCIWSFGNAAIDGIQEYFSEIFDNQAMVYTNNERRSISGSIYLRQVFRPSDMTLATVDDMFHKITAAMTVTMRTHGRESQSGQTTGVVWYQTTCMTIKWKWLAYPAALIGLSVVFLVLVAVESLGVESDRLWKSSVLATLFCHVDDIALKDFAPIGKQSINTIAYSTSVSLDTTESTIRLVS